MFSERLKEEISQFLTYMLCEYIPVLDQQRVKRPAEGHRRSCRLSSADRYCRFDHAAAD